MKTRPRIRRATLWGGVVVSAVLVVLWAVSMVWCGGWRARAGLGVGFENGAVGAANWEPYEGEGFPDFGFQSSRANGPVTWWVDAGGDDSTGWWVLIPLWMPLVVSLGVTAAAWRLEVLARRRVGKCASCGYDRAGLKVGAVCPECGAGSGREEKK